MYEDLRHRHLIPSSPLALAFSVIMNKEEHVTHKLIILGTFWFVFLFPNARRQGWVEAKGIVRWGAGTKGIKNGRLWETGQGQWASGL